MAEVGNPKAPEYAGVSVEHPSITNALENCAKSGVEKERAMKLVGMPMEVVDRVYRRVNKEEPKKDG